jgi:hypothetical protein
VAEKSKLGLERKGRGKRKGEEGRDKREEGRGKRKRKRNGDVRVVPSSRIKILGSFKIARAIAILKIIFELIP